MNWRMPAGNMVLRLLTSNWRKSEMILNEELPQFTRDIKVEGLGMLNVHYVHKKSNEPNAIPMLFVHRCE